MAVLKDFTKFMLAPVAEAFFFFQKSRGPRAYKRKKKKTSRMFPRNFERFSGTAILKLLLIFSNQLFNNNLEQLRLDTVLSIRCSRLEVFFKKSVPKTLTKLTEKHLFRSLFSNKVVGQTSADN